MPAPARFTLAEFELLRGGLKATGVRFELDHGTIIRMPPPNYPRKRLQARILTLVADIVTRSGVALLTMDELGVRLGDNVARAIDIAVFDDPGDEQGLVDARLVRLAVEVAETSLAYDLGGKAADYASAAIADYWVVDMNERVVHLFSDPQAGAFRRRSVVAFGSPLTAACLAGPVVFDA